MALSKSANNKIILLRIIRGSCFLVSLAFFLMWPFSYRFYTTLGIDSDYLESPGIVYARYWRVRWPGDGSFRVGSGGFRYRRDPAKGKPLQIFDLGGRFFQPGRRETSLSLWNDIGFWWIRTGLDDDLSRTWRMWIGVPSVVPAVLFAVITSLCGRTVKRRIASHLAKG